LSISNSSFVKLIAKLALFALLLSGPIAYIEYRIRHTVNNENLAYKYRYDELFQNKTKSDILVIGDSHGAHGIIPAIAQSDGHKMYNFCFNGASPSFNSDLYDIISNKYPKPKLIIYEVSHFMFDGKVLWRRINHDYKYIPTTYSSLASMPYNHLEITHEYEVFSALKLSLNKKTFSNILIQDYDNGFVPNETSFAPDSNSNSYKMSVSQKETACFEQLISRIKSQKIMIIFVETPEYMQGDSGYSYIVKRNNALIKQYADKYSIPFLNYNDERASYVNASKVFFSDPGHLNFLGARTFSKVLHSDIDRLNLSGIRPSGK
jgi:hypothetical protein